jgi:hypothetical protein
MIEGMVGLDVSGCEVKLHPRIPIDWKWLWNLSSSSLHLPLSFL